jgi:hypothetical protein
MRGLEAHQKEVITTVIEKGITTTIGRRGANPSSECLLGSIPGP